LAEGSGAGTDAEADAAEEEAEAGSASAPFGCVVWRPAHLDRGALENPKVNGDTGIIAHAAGADDANSGVVWRELLVLLECLAEGVQSVADQVCQNTYISAHIIIYSQSEHGGIQSAKDPKQCRSARTRTGVGWCSPARRKGSQRHTDAGRIPAYSPGPLMWRGNFDAGIKGRGEAGHDALSAMGDTRQLTGMGGLNTTLDPMAC